ncbi:MAG: hypothetical protein RMJ43_06310 [Chloroherpetonaceae bacterium]|nr:hypothetical protein [Chthonomonadaceae bacterium]MDW8207431.1 hypothetical protein [Chloroherpetonaceae bacterium]
MDDPGPIRAILWRASVDADFRGRLIRDPGCTLAEEGFVLSDVQMAVLRTHLEEWRGLEDRVAYERIVALARNIGM